jgi:tight adherence protein C
MLLLLFAGIGCLALLGFEITRMRTAVERDRQRALKSVRTAAGVISAPRAPQARRSLVVTRVAPHLAALHRRLWRKQTDDAIATELARAGASRRLTAELFMALRVALTVVLFAFGLLIAHGAGRVLLALVFGVAGIIIPGFLLSKAATRRAEKIDMELPHFVDQLALIIEAGMGFDAAVTYLADVSEGPLGEEMRRVLTELRVGESRRTAIRNFAVRVGSEDTMAFANAVLASDQLGSPLGGILRSQASDLRHRRQIHAEERAQKAPVKMLLPMAIFILPVMFVIILAPAFLGSHGLL